MDCDEEYTGESARAFNERFKELLKAPSPIFGHQSNTGYSVSVENFSVVGRERHNFIRTIKESIFITVNSPTLNFNIVEYNLTHI